MKLNMRVRGSANCQYFDRECRRVAILEIYRM